MIEAALVDWVKALQGFSTDQIEAGCQSYLRRQPSRRPAPADVRHRIQASYQQHAQPGSGNKNSLSMDERHLLENKILPTARRWLGTPALRDHGISTLAYWGERHD